MIAKSEFIVENIAYAKYKDQFDSNLELIDLINNVLEIYDQKKIKLNHDFNGVVQIIFTKSFALFVCVHHLCNLGFGLEAGILVRALLENVIELKYLEKEDSNLCQVFFENPGQYFKRLQNKGHKKISKRAEVAGMGKHYDRWYRDLSKVFHLDYRGILPRISESQGILHFDIGPSLNHVKEPLLLSQYYFNIVFNYFCKSFELIEKEVLETGEKNLQKFEEMILNTQDAINVDIEHVFVTSFDPNK